MDQHQILLQNKIVKTTFAIKSKEAAIQSIDELEDEKVYREVSRMFILQSKSSLKVQLEKEMDDLKTLLNKMKNVSVALLDQNWKNKFTPGICHHSAVVGRRALQANTVSRRKSFRV